MVRGAQVGQYAPDFKAFAVFEQDFTEIQLADYRNESYVILLFYPIDFTFICPTELLAFSKEFNRFSDLNTEILAISVDSEYAHLTWSQMSPSQGGVGTLNFPLVSDLKKDISRKYNLLTENGVALRGLFIIDKEGIIQHVLVNNLEVGRNVEETLRVLQAIQHVEQYPDEVCPVNWKPGDETIISIPDKSKKYFQKFF